MLAREATKADIQAVRDVPNGVCAYSEIPSHISKLFSHMCSVQFVPLKQMFLFVKPGNTTNRKINILCKS